MTPFPLAPGVSIKKQVKNKRAWFLAELCRLARGQFVFEQALPTSAGVDATFPLTAIRQL